MFLPWLVGCYVSDAELFEVMDSDGDGHLPQVVGGGDCDDDDRAVHPDAVEACGNGIDDDCDGHIDDRGEGERTFYVDADEDGWGTEEEILVACERPAGWAEQPGDCAPTDRAVHPGATDTCDGADQDCDDEIDEDAPLLDWYGDQDADGYGDDATVQQGCAQPAGYVEVGGDCDDQNPFRNPGQVDFCDDVDQDCDDEVDEDATFSDWYADLDEDGHGRPKPVVNACAQPTGMVAAADDCDDANAAVFPGALELCNGVDDDCSGIADDALVFVDFYRDADGDGFGDPADVQNDCTAPPGYVQNDFDCDDGDASIRPGQTDVCDDVDEDCDGLLDEDVPWSTWYADDDGDGAGGAPIDACAQPAGTVAGAGDCDDTDPLVQMRTWSEDLDGDGYGDPATDLAQCTDPGGWVQQSGDCDDADPAVSPGEPEVCNDFVDNSCTPTDDCRWSGIVPLSAADVVFAGGWSGVEAVPDVNGDGLPEVAVADSDASYGGDTYNGVIYVFPSPFTPGSTYDVGDTASTLYGAVDNAGAGDFLRASLDLTANGRPDIVVGSHDAVFVANVNTDVPLTASTAAREYTLSFTEWVNDIEVVYGLTSSGRRSVAVGVTNGGIAGSVYLLHDPVPASGSLGSVADVVIGASEHPSAGPAGDQNGDGIKDLAITENRFGFTPFLSIVDGTSSGSIDTATSSMARFDGPVGPRLGAVTSGDLDGDGQDDVLVASPAADNGPYLSAGLVHVLRGPALTSGSLDTAAWQAWSGAADEELGTEVEVGDWDGDGFDDVAASTSSYTARVRVWYGPIAGGSAESASADVHVDFAGSPTLAGDLNQDGLDDLLTLQSGMLVGGAQLYLGLGL